MIYEIDLINRLSYSVVFVGYEQIASIIVMIGRAFVTSGGCVVVIMQEELHPTPVKQKIVGIENGISLAITIAGPYLTELVRFTILNKRLCTPWSYYQNISI